MRPGATVLRKTFSKRSIYFIQADVKHRVYFKGTEKVFDRVYVRRLNKSRPGILNFSCRIV